MKKKTNIGLIGAGYWGMNLIRNFNNLGVLKIVSDTNIKKKDEVFKVSPSIKFSLNYKDILNDKSITAVVISTPALSHYKLTYEALLSGKHAFVEKPLCLGSKKGKKLVDLAKKSNLKIMVGHLMLYHPAFIKMKEKIKSGLIGNIRYIYSNRLSLGKLRKEEDVLWSFAPHDISMILNLVKTPLLNIEAFGGSYLAKKIKDTTLTMLTFKKNIKAHIFVSWLHPYKDQRLIVIGDKGMIVFADTEKDKNKLLFYDHDVRWEGAIPIISKSKGKTITFNFKKEPLLIECKSFINWIEKKIKPPSVGEEGLRVLNVLESAKKKLGKIK